MSTSTSSGQPTLHRRTFNAEPHRWYKDESYSGTISETIQEIRASGNKPVPPGRGAPANVIARLSVGLSSRMVQIAALKSGHLNLHTTGNLLKVIRAQGDAGGICTSRRIYSVILIK